MTPVVTGLHQEVVLRCVVTANPLPKIEWQKDGKPVTGITHYENFTATFTIRETNESSGGMYTCRASNEAGMAECSATIVIQGQSSAVLSLYDELLGGVKVNPRHHLT